MATSKLQRETSRLLSIYLGCYTIRENIRPDWLITPNDERLELDFFIEEINVAIEVQGQQHYTFVPHFHRTQEGFKQRLAWDRFKRDRCEKMGIGLYEIADQNDIYRLIERLTSYRTIFLHSPPRKHRRPFRHKWAKHVKSWSRIIGRERRMKKPRLDRIEKYSKKIVKKLTSLGVLEEDALYYIDQIE